MPNNKNSEAIWPTDSMIWYAKSLQSVVKQLERNGSESLESDPFLIHGTTLAKAILLSLATEIALKALLCLERKKAPPKTHDLLELFNKLEPDTQELLRAEMPGWPDILKLLKLTPFEYGSLPELLDHHRDAHTRWRFIYEKGWGVLRTSELDEALTVIINAYGKRCGDAV